MTTADRASPQPSGPVFDIPLVTIRRRVVVSAAWTVVYAFLRGRIAMMIDVWGLALVVLLYKDIAAAKPAT